MQVLPFPSLIPVRLVAAIAGPAMAARIDVPDWWNCRKDRRARALQKSEHDRFLGLPGPDLVRAAIDGKLLRDLE